MNTLTIKCGMLFPIFGLRKWKSSDFAKPLVLNVQHAKVHIYAHEDKYAKNDIVVFVAGHLEIIFSPPPKCIIEGLLSTGQPAVEAARTIYDIYREAQERFEALLMSAGKVTHLLTAATKSFHELFTKGFGLLDDGVHWKLDDAPYRCFSPPLAKPSGRNPLSTAAQLVTPARWQQMQQAADNNDIPSDELLELLKTRSKAGWRQRRVAVIEASIVSEVLLRLYGLKVLSLQGFSNNKIKKLRDELSFNSLLNIVLPLSLTKKELGHVAKALHAVDVLRGIRNDLVHGNITEKEVDDVAVAQGIDGAIRLATFLKEKIKVTSG